MLWLPKPTSASQSRANLYQYQSAPGIIGTSLVAGEETIVIDAGTTRLQLPGARPGPPLAAAR